MSVIDDVKYVKPFAGAIAKGTSLFYSGEILETASDRYLARDRIREPFDVPDHIGNFREGAMATVFAFGAIGIFTLFDKTREKFSRNAKWTAVGAFAASSVAQIAGEGLELTNDLNASNVGNTADAVYGIGWSAVVAAGAYQATTSFVESRRNHQSAAQ